MIKLWNEIFERFCPEVGQPIECQMSLEPNPLMNSDRDSLLSDCSGLASISDSDRQDPYEAWVYGDYGDARNAVDGRS